MPEPQQMPTPESTPSKSNKSRPASTQRMNAEESTVTTDEDPGYESRNRSASRRRRRKNQRQRSTQAKAEAGQAKSNSKAMATLPEDEDEEEDDDEPTEEQKRIPYAKKENWLKNPATQDTTETQPFEHIKPPSQSMDGPVTYARMMRKEIPWRGGPPLQPYDTTQGVDGKTHGADPMEQDGLKLRIELNLDIEIELKAHIHGDITLALLA